MPLRFGPYAMPRFKIGQHVECVARGEVRIVGVSDAPVQWPLGSLQGGKSPVLFGSLVRAVRTEAACDVMEAWGVGSGMVGKWRKALRVRITEGQHLRQSEGIKASDPARARKIAAAKRGKPRPQWIIEAMAKARTGMKLTKATRAKMRTTHKARGTRPPWLNPAWSAKEDRLARTKPPAEVARLTGRSFSAVLSRRHILGVSRCWTPKLDQIVRANSPVEAAKLTGKSLQAVYCRRSVLGVNDGPQKRYLS